MENQIILYQAEDKSTSLEVRVEDEQVWLRRHQIAKLFKPDYIGILENNQSINQSIIHSIIQSITFHVIFLYFRTFEKHPPFISDSSVSLYYGKQ